MRSFLLVLVTSLGVLGPGCTCAGRDPGASGTSEAGAPGGGDAAGASSETTAGVAARIDRKRPVLRGPIDPTRLRQRPGLTRGLINGRGVQVADSAAPAASDAPAP